MNDLPSAAISTPSCEVGPEVTSSGSPSGKPCRQIWNLSSFLRSGKSICHPGTRHPRYMCCLPDPRFERFHRRRKEQPGTAECSLDCPFPPPTPIAGPEKEKNDAPCCGLRKARKPPAFA